MEDEYEYEDGELTNEEAMAILDAYRTEQIKRHSVGPAVSFVFHIACLLLLSIYVVAKPRAYSEPVAIVSEILEVKIPDEKIIEEVKEVQEEVADDAPKMEVPTLSAETVADSAMEDVSDEAPETDDNLDMEEVMDVVNNPTALKLPSLYGGRNEKGRAGNSRKYGAFKGGSDSVDKSLKWLAKVQLDNGSWEGEPAPTGLALLCFLAHGDTPLSEEYGVTVQKAIQWLATNMPDGKAWGKGDGHVAYAHGIATYALAEAYGMTQIPFLVGPMESGIKIIVDGQQENGGWDYNYKKGARWDLSVAGWQMQALKAAYISGSTNPGIEKAIEKSIKFCKNEAYKGNADYLGTFGYTSAGKDSGSKSMTPIGAVGLQLLGEFDSEEAQGASRATLARLLPTYEKAMVDWDTTASTHLYGWYYATQAVFQYTKGQGPEWTRWNKVFQSALLRNQNPEGYWTHKERHHMGGESLKGKVLSTTFCCLQLQVYYRYLGSFKISDKKIVQLAPLGEGEGALQID
jgi:hypothetical protein